jgi:hypothetical protein
MDSVTVLIKESLLIVRKKGGCGTQFNNDCYIVLVTPFNKDSWTVIKWYKNRYWYFFAVVHTLLVAVSKEQKEKYMFAREPVFFVVTKVMSWYGGCSFKT